jgi:plastocyanin
MHRSRPAGRLAALFLVLALAACGNGGNEATDGGDTGNGGDPAGETVSLANNAFSPSSLTITAGTTVTFTDTATHTVTEGTDGAPAEDPIVDEAGGADIDVTFEEPGTYPITCKIHPEMNMTITVEG